MDTLKAISKCIDGVRRQIPSITQSGSDFGFVFPPEFTIHELLGIRSATRRIRKASV
jgi:hypothetical protein